jgi:hypothetical protein
MPTQANCTEKITICTVPKFAAIILLLPTHAQDNAGEIVQKRYTEFLLEIKPHAQKLLMQFLMHLPTHHPDIEKNIKYFSVIKKHYFCSAIKKEKYGCLCKFSKN